ncbi:hypothetical protein PS15m_009147 [Mucor circinelloides]
MTLFIRVHYLPWHSALFVTIASLGFAFGSLACLVLSAMAINGFLTQGDYPPIVMAQEAIVLCIVVVPMGLSCFCECFTDNRSRDGTAILISQFPLPYMMFDLFAFIFRTCTTGFYLKQQYFSYYSESKRNAYIVETSAVLIMVLLWILSLPFAFSFHVPLFKKRANDAVPAAEKLNYKAKQYSLITFLVTIESWTESTVKDEEEGAVAVPTT